MKRKGYVLLEILVGIFLIGLISTTYFPIITSSFRNFNRIKDRTEMIYIAEMVAERLKVDKELSKEIIPKLEGQTSIDFEDENIDDIKYKCTLQKINSSNRMIDLNINISTKDQENKFNVYLKTSIPK